MLVTFNSKNHNDVTMFGDVAKSLINMMGFSTDVPGAIRADDVATALANLEMNIARVNKNSILNQEAPQSIDIDDTDDNDLEPEISLSVRAKPLIDLLKSAVELKEYVMWQ